MRKVTLRNLLARKLRLVMSGFAIVLGVAFVAASFIFTDAIQRTFDNITAGTVPDISVQFEGTNAFDAEMIFNRTTRAIEPDLVDQIAALDGVERADGSIEGIGLFVLDPDGDLIGGQGAPTLSFTYNDMPNMFGEDIIEFREGSPPGSGEIVIDTFTADRVGFEVGDTVTMVLPGPEPELQARISGIAGLAGGGGLAGATLVMFDDTTAQQIFLDGRDAYSSVIVQAEEAVDVDALADRIAAVLPEGLEAATGERLAEEADEGIAEFLGFLNIFLLIFAGIALVVGMFLIINTFSILVAQRSRELALLRALGASAGQVNRSVLAEATVVGFLGSALGLLAGYGLSYALRWLFTFIGMDISGSSMTIEPRTVIVAFAVGVPVTILAALVPARRASKIPPIAALRDEIALPELQVRRRVITGAVLTAVGASQMVAGLAGVWNGAVLVGSGVLHILIGVSFLSPLLARPVIGGFGKVFVRRSGGIGHLAVQNTLRNPRRTAATSSALMIGLALVTSMSVFGASATASVDAGVDEQFEADILISDATGMNQPFSPLVGEQAREVDGVDVVSVSQVIVADVDEDQRWLVATDESFFDIYTLEELEGTTRVEDGQIAVTDWMAEAYDVEPGDTLTVEVSNRPFELDVVGVFEGNEVVPQALVTLDIVETAELQRADASVSLLVADGADVEAVQEALSELVSDNPLVTVQNQEEFADAIKAQINTILFLIYGLLALAVVIAVLGIVNTLALSVIERTREIGLIRAVGTTRGQLRGMVLVESVAIALFGALLGLVMGVIFGVVLQRSLADDIPNLSIPVGQLLVFLAVSAVFGVLAALLPARRAAKLNVLNAITTE